MSKYYPGYLDAVADVQKADQDTLLRLLDDLYGRDNLRFGDGLEQIRTEALRQLSEEWKDKTGDMRGVK